MPRIAVTGHMNLTSGSLPILESAILDRLSEHDPSSTFGISCIARGADSVFAQALLKHGGKLEVITPSRDYRKTKVKPSHASTYDHLLESAWSVTVLPFDIANREAYEAANEKLLSRCDILYAVWDGHMSADQGGTGAVFFEASKRGVPTVVIWPDGLKRQS